MSLAPLAEIKRLAVDGCFVEAATGDYYEFARDQKDAPWTDYRDKIWTGPNEQFRWGKVLKTVARVVIDEGSDGSPIIEKWILRKLSDWRKT